MTHPFEKETAYPVEELGMVLRDTLGMVESLLKGHKRELEGMGIEGHVLEHMLANTHGIILQKLFE